jgi:hypothetical protein
MEKHNVIIKLLLRVKTMGVRLYSHHPFPSQKRKKKENKSE